MNDYAPENEAQVAEIIRQHAGTAIPLRLVGADTKMMCGAPQGTATLRSTTLKDIVAYNPNEMVMTARTGTPVAEIEMVLAAAGQMMTFEPADYRRLLATSGEPTIGGVFAANISGPRRFVAGAARDSLLGVRFVNGRGEVVKNGGRVMKNVTGLDLVKLMAGSCGTLGLISEVTFRVPPRHRCTCSLVISGLDDGKAVTAMAAAMALPLAVSGAAHLPVRQARRIGGGGVLQEAATILRLEGLEQSVASRRETLQQAMAVHGEGVMIDQDDCAQIWRAIRDVHLFADGTERPVWRISVAPSAGHQIVAAFRDEEIDAFYDWQGGLIWMRMRQDDPQAERLRQLVATYGGGHATLVRASDRVRARIAPFQPQGTAIAALSKRIKRAFDPAGIFNTGMMSEV